MPDEMPMPGDGMKSEGGNESNSGNFVDKYLQHLEKRDSREGTTKWLLMVAVAALLWKLADIAFEANIKYVGRLVGGCLLAYYVCQFAYVLASHSDTTTRLRFRRRTGYKELSRVCALSVRFCLTGILALIFFRTAAEPLTWMMAGPPLVLGFILLAITLSGFKDKYDVLKPNLSNESLWAPIGMAALFILPVIVGMAVYVQQNHDFVGTFGLSDVVNLKSSALIIVIIFLIEKYVKSLRMDSEISAVSNIWRRLGVGEISSEKASNELRMIIAGASLDEVTYEDVEAHSNKLRSLEDIAKTAELELDQLHGIGSDNSALRGALVYSLRKRAADMSTSLDDVDAHRGRIISNVKKMLGEDSSKYAESKALESSLSEQTDTVRRRVKSVLANIEVAAGEDL